MIHFIILYIMRISQMHHPTQLIACCSECYKTSLHNKLYVQCTLKAWGECSALAILLFVVLAIDADADSRWKLQDSEALLLRLQQLVCVCVCVVSVSVWVSVSVCLTTSGNNNLSSNLVLANHAVIE